VLALVTILLPINIASAGTIQVLTPVTEADARLGLCDVLPGAPSSPGAPSWAQLAYNAGARVNRWEFRWDRIEPHRGQWNFGPDDADVGSSRQYNLALDGIIDGIPQWAVAPGQPRGNGIPRGLWRPAGSTRNLWADFLRGLVAHYRGVVSYWEIWNEPDLKFFWNGTARDYARLLKVASSVIRAADPNARVMVAGMVVPDLAFAGQVLADLRSGSSTNSPPFDVAAWHAYGNASALYTNLVRFRALLARDGFPSTPIWVTEDGFPASNPHGEARQAAYILQTVAYADAAGASHVLIYRASDDPSPTKWGVMTAAGTPRQGYVAYQVAAEYLSHSQALVHDPSAQLERFVFYQAGRRVVLLWNRSGQDHAFSVPAGHPNATLVDWMGQQSSLSPLGGAWSGTVPGAGYNRGIDPKNAVVGGPPELLVEDNTSPSTLPLTSFVSPVSGQQRELVLVNPGDAPATAQVTAASDANLRQVVEVAPNSIARVDLDLLAGPSYSGAYTLADDSALTAVASSTSISVPDVSPASDWYLASAPPTVSLSNPQTAAAHVSVAAFGRQGRALGQSRVTLQAGATTSWSVPGHPGQHAITVHADSAVLVTDPSGVPLTSATAPSNSWYALHPGSTGLSLFNPGSAPTVVAAHFVGAPTVKEEQLRLLPLHSYSLAPHGARAVTLQATGGVVVTYHGSGSSAAPQSQPVTNAGLAAVGSQTHVELFNPADQPAHVTMRLVTAKSTTTITRDLKPLHYGEVSARAATGPPSGVLVNSDVPVVAATGP
jgi:hypothetical protein